MKKRYIKKSCDHGIRLNRIELKKGFNILSALYLAEKEKTKNLGKKMLRLEGIYEELLADRDKTIERTKMLNQNLSNILQSKIQEVADLDKKMDELNSKYILERENTKYLKERLEIKQESLRYNYDQTVLLKEKNVKLEIEIQRLKTPIWKRFMLRRKQSESNHK